jgi:(p)ppGpp synthase/HD superfamily hydrolase
MPATVTNPKSQKSQTRAQYNSELRASAAETCISAGGTLARAAEAAENAHGQSESRGELLFSLQLEVVAILQEIEVERFHGSPPHRKRREVTGDLALRHYISL